MRLETNYRKNKLQKHKHMEVKQYATKQPIDHQRNKGGNQKLLRDKGK